ncbi:GDP-mannose mannosyl hydrolase [Alteromonas ponticola]|uniref:GDP-mannose mannosyl hydrolase n=1 Tax=Alteromonas aquimaris TaxID=2998417 RepID=A0ABT3P5M0_9ALTE|nr:GDP-mannose mannosyl hydrolase [Alteromonas aquimaris]MCW8108054.1 GDP-mannose mannosyl hydrolase [Alteromonas aquimaris]
MYLDTDTFSTVLKSTPLISIDLLVQNQQNQFLLGKRSNQPAKNYWFVPGGRIYKNESIGKSFDRIAKEEFGTCFSIENAKLLGLFEHFYANSVLSESISTHYVVIAYKLEVDQLVDPPDVQHTAYKWFSKNELLRCNDVHHYTKAYIV